MPTLATALLETASSKPDAIALSLDDHTVTYRDFARMASCIAEDLQASGLEPGDRVGLVLPNVPAFAVHFYGIQLAGMVAVPMNPLLKEREVRYHLEDSGTRRVFALTGMDSEVLAGAPAGVVVDSVDPFASHLAGREPGGLTPVERSDGDDCVILYTSGTTGRPKGARLTQRNMYTNAAMASSSILELTSADVVMGCLPLFHVFGLTCGLNSSVMCGARLTLLPRFDSAKALEILQRDGVTLFEGVPTMYQGLLAVAAQSGEPLKTEALRTCVSGGSAMPVEVMKAFEKRFGCMILEGYGLSETSPVATFNMPDRERRPGTVGTAVPGVEVRILDAAGEEVARGEVGEVAVRGENVMAGYWQNPEATEAAIPNGWFLTGDLGRQDSDGYVTIVDRKKDMILHGGYNVYPREVEEVLYEHPAVAEVAVVGIPDDHYGENVAAAVAVREGSTATEEELIGFVASRLAAYKKPKHIWFVDELPKGPTGKILRREVRQPGA